MGLSTNRIRVRQERRKDRGSTLTSMGFEPGELDLETIQSIRTINSEFLFGINGSISMLSHFADADCIHNVQVRDTQHGVACYVFDHFVDRDISDDRDIEDTFVIFYSAEPNLRPIGVSDTGDSCLFAMLPSRNPYRSLRYSCILSSPDDPSVGQSRARLSDEMLAFIEAACPD